MLRSITNGLGEYAAYAFQEDNLQKKMEKGQEMLSVIVNAEEKCNTLNNSDLCYSLAIAYRNYCAWFVRGEQKQKYLEKCIFYLNKALYISPCKIEAKSELGSLLIEENVVRNLSRGIELLEEIKKDNNMPSYLNSVLAKAQPFPF